MNVQHFLIQESMHSVFELGYNAADATKNICCTKGEGTVVESTVTRNFHKILLKKIWRDTWESLKFWNILVNAS